MTALWLGKKAKKNIQAIANLSSLHKFALRGIKVDDFYFLQNTSIEELKILWCGMNDLGSLAVLENLKYLELWKITKLEDIAFIKDLKKLETLILRDLRHIKELPDLSGLHHLKQIRLDNMKIDKSSISDDLKPIMQGFSNSNFPTSSSKSIKTSSKNLSP